MNRVSDRLNVGLADRSYQIVIGHDCLVTLAAELDRIAFPRKLAVVTNSTVGPLYLDKVVDLLSGAGYSVASVTIPDGEEFKTLSVMESVITELIEAGCDRSSGLIALGGGVVGDLAGYAAASYLRGIPFVQIPTTLLAQVDSSVGGKTGVNHKLGKNLIGAFYQPRLVLIDVAVLMTLDDRDLRAGLAEVVKYGVIHDETFLDWLASSVTELLHRDAAVLIRAIKKSCQIKANIVENDEKESSLRAILNYGHTFGHAIEQLAGYGRFRHGEAVSVGMLVAAEIARQKGFCSQDDVQRLRSLLLSFQLPVEIPEFPLQDYLAAMGRDKKVQQGRLRMVLNRGLGQCMIEEIDDPEALFASLLGR